MKITKRVSTNSSNKAECNKEEIQSKENCNQPEEIKEQSEVKACDSILPTGECVSCCKYDNAINFIQCAIESLAEIAKDDSYIVIGEKLVLWDQYKVTGFKKIMKNLFTIEFMSFVFIGCINTFNGVLFSFLYSLLPFFVRQ
jgi:hypothetical protein